MPPILQTVANFRDVGETVNRYQQSECVLPKHSLGTR
jgi:hypothetical protein